MAFSSISAGKRARQPELEADYNRSPALGYEPSAEVGFIRCLDHGFPTPLARWHCHDEYELHMIVATSGKAFVGDWIGPFEPGHVVLCGPRLPHNWISTDVPEEGIEKRDLVIQFLHAPIENASRLIPELGELMPLLERARHGVEFFGFAEAGERHWHRVKAAKGMRRLTAFIDLMADLARWNDYRLLSSVQMQGADNDAELDQINAIVSRITENVAQSMTAGDFAAELGMSESRFSRFFRRATGNTYTDFVNQVRINRACQLLMGTDRYVTNICYDVGFNNVANFNRRFRELKGLTPTEFRRQAESRFGGSAAEAAKGR
ncbi:AraC family transcriptional regulator [Propionivibrio sp.]|uniref:AraC family transcriptional regulator n=1 Tax=Propionivibrio sp. TaxID=2212460 RepID=UPI0039E5A57C